MSTARIELPPKLIPVFAGNADIRGAWGGRGSGKTRNFAKMTAVRAYIWSKAGKEGLILCGREWMNSLEDSSLEELKAAIRSEPWLEAHFEIGDKYIRTKDGRISYTFAGLNRNISSIKGKSRLLLVWVDEAEDVTENSWSVILPTLREEGAELWVNWNPRRKNSATHKRFRAVADDPLTKIVAMNWRDNPWFTALLDRTRLKDQRERPASYGHIWEGEFATVAEGAYFAASINQAKADGRIGRVAADPLMTIRLFADIGGTGARADNFVFWAAQFIGREIRVIDHYEQQGQPIASHLNWLRSRGYTPDKAQIWLPHDGRTQDRVMDVSYESALKEAGYTVTVIKNQGAGAAKMRVEAARRLFPATWINEATTTAGMDALGWYHPKIDVERGIDLGPEHDFASHSADAWGLMCVAYEAPKDEAPKRDMSDYMPSRGGVGFPKS